MTDYRTMFDKDYIGAWDLQGDTVVTITHVEAKKIKNADKKEDRKPILTLQGYDKKMVCNVTNANTIAALYGKHVEDWVGKRITLFVAEVTAFGKTTDCIRVRPKVPSAGKATAAVLQFLDEEGASETFQKGGDWLARAEQAIEGVGDDVASTLWERNQDTYFAIQASVTKKGDPTMIERVASLGRIWNEKRNAAIAAE